VSEKGKDRLFLAYANYSLRVDPKNFFKIYDAVDRYHPFLANLKNLRLVIEVIVASASFGRPDYKVPDDDVLRIAQEAVYGYRDGFCEKTCPMRELRQANWGREPFEGPDRWKCIECDQRDFIRMITELIEGKDYDQVDNLLILLAAGRQFLYDFEGRTRVFPIPEPSTKKPMEFKRPKSQDPLLIVEDDWFGPYKLAFRNYWNGLIGYSLSEFLYEDDDNRKRLKLCPYCNEFFKADSVDKEICYSQSCEKARQREQKRPYMKKKRDPDSPEFDLRYKTREFTKKKPS
jgi:hypothetical protein